jgi:hypothetical protein
MSGRKIRSAALIGALALAAAACGSSSTDPTNADANPGAAGACLVGEPECYDIGVIQGGPDDPELAFEDPDVEVPVPDEGQIGSGGGATSSAMPVDGGLTVSEALATDATGILAVQGHLYDDGSGPTLCESLEGGGERYVCGGPQLAVDNFDPGTVAAQIVIHDGLTYTEDTLTLFGELVDGMFVVDDLVAG